MSIKLTDLIELSPAMVPLVVMYTESGLRKPALGLFKEFPD